MNHGIVPEAIHGSFVERPKLTHLQMRRLEQLGAIDVRSFRHNGAWLTSHWNSSKAANQKLCDLGLAERYGQTFNQPSGTVNTVGDVRITQAGRDLLAGFPKPLPA